MPPGANIWGTSSLLQVSGQAELVSAARVHALILITSPVTFREVQRHPAAWLHKNCTEHLHSYQGSYTTMKYDTQAAQLAPWLRGQAANQKVLSSKPSNHWRIVPTFWWLNSDAGLLLFLS